MPVIRNLIQFEKHKKCETVQFSKTAKPRLVTNNTSLLIFMQLATWNTVIIAKRTNCRKLASPIPDGASWQLYINTNDQM